MSKKVMIEVDEDAMKKLDDFIHFVYRYRCEFRNEYVSIWEDDTDELWIAKMFVRNAKPVAKAFGLYPYNQPIVNNP